MDQCGLAITRTRNPSVKGKTRVKESCPFSRSTGILPAPTVRCITRFYYAVNCSDCCVSLAISAASRVCTRVRARALSLFPRLFFFSFLFPAPLPPPPLLLLRKTVHGFHELRNANLLIEEVGDVIAYTHRGEASPVSFRRSDGE